jgi:hypothetical protein
VTLADGRQARLPELFRDGAFVLLDRVAAEPAGEAAGEAAAEASAAAAGAAAAAGRLAAVRYRSATVRLPASVLVRPDGYVAWASDEPDPAARAAAALAAARLWCGPGVLTSPG